ncbi:hypothetical protein F7725_002601 [Dissostichus mawsoni]|uniref:Uncharacterized protein n=1 Tax=Dissostichus mawsoni TaxID=36200 RepID=A0A7J5Y2U2_DISMA|nr:hypothetical protein F7725_002601 [Dissostichus mawsoni]
MNGDCPITARHDRTEVAFNSVAKKYSQKMQFSEFLSSPRVFRSENRRVAKGPYTPRRDD